MEGITNIGLGYLSAGLGGGLATIGAALGIGKIAGSACEGIARQPEASDDIFRTMLIPAVMIEAIGLFVAVASLIMALRT